MIVRTWLWLCLLSLWAGADTLICFDCLPRDHRVAVFVPNDRMPAPAGGRWLPLTADSEQNFRLPDAARGQSEVRFRLSRQGYQDHYLTVPADRLRAARVRLPGRLDQLIALQPALATVTFQTRPSGAETYLQLPGGQLEYLGLSGQPVALNLAKVTGGSQQGLFYVEFRKSGHSSLRIPIPSYSLVGGETANWPEKGVIPLPSTVPRWIYALPLLLGILLWRIRRSPLARTNPAPTRASIGPYELVLRVGSGASGTVYQGRLQSGALCAIKVLHHHWADDSRVSGQFLKEAAILAKLKHPNIVAVYDWGEDLGRPYLVTEWLEGRDLRNALAGEALGSSALRQLLAQAAAGLAAAHAAGVVHRDIKPENLIVREGHACWVDFGLAQTVSEAVPDLSGTPGYLAPERLNGAPASAASDQFALGVLAFEALTGILPEPTFQPDLDFGANLRKLRPGLDGQLAAVVERMLAVDPQARYPSLEHVRQALSVGESAPPLHLVRSGNRASATPVKPA